jgi:peptidoglycan/xylan/chitin deacetylase (PgdA/CDA1 family)
MPVRERVVSYSRLSKRMLALFALAALTVMGIVCQANANRLNIELDFRRAFTPVIISGDPLRPDVALTFDDGPNPFATPQILTELEHAHVHATFFVVGKLAQTYPRIIARMVRDGDAVESHSWGHEYTVVELPSAFRHSLQKTDKAIEAAGAPRPAYFRPPYGVHAPWTVEQSRANGENVVIWNVPLTDDWDQPGTKLIVDRTMASMQPGAIMVLHDGNEADLCRRLADCDRRQEIAATPMLIRKIRELNLHPVTIPELMETSSHVNRIASRGR